MTLHSEIPKFMKAAILIKTNEPLLLVEEVKIPPLAPYQVLVKISYSGICQSQLMECSGGRGPDPYLPHLLGHEAWGQVVATGRRCSKGKGWK